MFRIYYFIYLELFNNYLLLNIFNSNKIKFKINLKNYILK